MAGFKMHLTTSTVAGCVYGALGHYQLQLPLPTCIVAGGLCSLSGILPDLDSSSGKPVREIASFTSAVVPLLLMERLARQGMTHEAMFLAGGCMYIIIRFGLFELLQRFTVHRGMWHSLPAAAIATLVAAMLCSGNVIEQRLFKVFGVTLGYLVHLTLDEIYSIQLGLGGLRFKKSFGTALKFWGSDGLANISVYAMVISLAILAANDPMYQRQLDASDIPIPKVANDWLDTQTPR